MLKFSITLISLALVAAVSTLPSRADDSATPKTPHDTVAQPTDECRSKAEECFTSCDGEKNVDVNMRCMSTCLNDFDICSKPATGK